MTSAPFLDTLVYLDGTEGSISALMYSIMLAKSTDTRLHVLYVVNTKALGDLVKSHIFVDQEKSEYLMDLKKDLFNLRLQHATNQLENPVRIAEVKKDIARVKTIIREQQLAGR